MKKIGLISDTHGFLDPRIRTLFEDVDEVWHAGDVGSMEVLKELREFKPLRVVWGNADSQEVRQAILPQVRHVYSEEEVTKNEEDVLMEGAIEFCVEGIKVLMIHIGGYPKRYAAGVREMLQRVRPQIFVAGHSHILKVIYDKEIECLHLNPGACGRYGIHTVRTALKFAIEGTEIRDMQVIEFGVK